jgi:hypothetical protein
LQQGQGLGTHHAIGDQASAGLKLADGAIGGSAKDAVGYELGTPAHEGGLDLAYILTAQGRIGQG